jgi:hypothetical protein
MRLFIWTGLFTFLSVSTVNLAVGQITPAQMNSTTKPSSTISGRQHLEPIKSEPDSKSGATSPSKESLPTPVKLPQPVPQQAEYLHPGILVYLNGKWEGSDHLLNLSENIGVYISIIKPENELINITEAQLQKEIQAVFAQADIKPQTLVTEGKPPLPAFQIEVFIYPIERGYVACCDGRLFESVTLERFKMDPNMAFQAITWEKQHLIVSPKDQFSEQLSKIIQEIATAFIERFQAYEKIKKSATS